MTVNPQQTSPYLLGPGATPITFGSTTEISASVAGRIYNGAGRAATAGWHLPPPGISRSIW